MGSSSLMKDESYIELLKIQRLFAAKFSLSPQKPGDRSSSLSLEEAHSCDHLVLNLAFIPTDPAFDRLLLGADKGINFCFNLSRKAEGNTTAVTQSSQIVGSNPDDSSLKGSDPPSDGVGHYTINGVSDIHIANDSIPKDVQAVIKKVILAFLAKYRHIQKYAIYESLKFLDREIRHIFELCESRRAKPAESAGNNPVAWSLEEQKSLEFALSKTKGLTDPQQRWNAVANIVKTKTADECRLRFQRCREQLKQKTSEEQNPVTDSKDEWQPVLSKSEALVLSELKLTKISVFNVTGFATQLICTRCESQFDATFIEGEKKTMEVKRICDICRISQRCQFLPNIAFSGNPTLGNLSLENCAFRDFIYGEFYVTCEDCDTQCKFREVRNGSSRNSNCRGCFAKLTLGFNTVEFGSGTPAAVTPIISVKKAPVRVERKEQSSNRGMKVGTPLPDNGTCKHYKKSFRWFRFPCCGKLFPCDNCHDEQSDHPHEQANIIVCGHCSTQQPVSNKTCRYCEKGYTASKSSYWEGGKGCRDASKLSRKDSKKYKLMRRQREQPQGGKGDK